MFDKELVMYSRSYGCPYVSTAKAVLDEFNISYREIMIDEDPLAEQRVIEWTGFRSVPTMIIAHHGENVPYTNVDPLPTSASPRGVDRGAMLTEASAEELEYWLRKHGLIK